MGRPSSTSITAARLQRTLRRIFHLDALREGQEAVIRRVLDGGNTIAIMPTGAGKSLCYQLPAVLLPGRTVVISPLIALMKDQCERLRERGIAAVQVNSAVDPDELREAEAAIAAGEARIIFATPERLADRGFIALVTRHPVGLLAIDEAHCISQWGHDFRPAFLEIGAALAPLGRPTVLALTATASQSVIEDVGRQLGLEDFAVINTGVFRPNLHYAVEQVTSEEEKLERARRIVREQRGSGIVYTATVKATEAVHEALVADGIEATLYHGRLAAGARHANQDAFMSGQARVMVATNAFGLGIDKPDIRFVLHYQMPGGLDAYYQESGRAGRDGDTALCLLLYLHQDRAVQQFFLAGKYPALHDVVAVYEALRSAPPAGEPAWTLALLLKSLEHPRAKVQVALSLLRHQHVVRQDRQGRLLLLEAGLGSEGLDALARAYRDKRETDRASLEQMSFYGQTGYCRWRVLLEHFGEGNRLTRCGHCDNCERMQAEERLAAGAAARPASPPLRRPNPEPLRTALFERGAGVTVPRYGIGIVEESDGRTVTVRFANGATRCFLGSYVHAASGRRRRAARRADG